MDTSTSGHSVFFAPAVSGPIAAVVTLLAAHCSDDTLPETIPFQQVKQLRSNIGAAERELRASPGNDQSLRRLGILKSSLDETISSAATQAAQADPSVAQRLAALGGGANDTSAFTMGGGGGSSPGNAFAVYGEQGAGSAGGEGRSYAPGPGAMPAGVAAGGGGSVAGAGGLGNFTPQSLGKYLEARQATYNLKQTYGQGPVGQVLQAGRYGAPHNVQDAAVTGRFINSGAASPAAVAAYMNAVGGDANAVNAMREGLVSDLRNKGIVKPDGTINSNSFTTWQARHRDTIAQFPGLGDEFASTQRAQDALDRATAGRKAAREAFEDSAAGKFIGADPLKAVGHAFASPNPTGTFAGLANLVKGHPDAEAGLRRAVVNHILEKARSSTPSGEANDFLKAHIFRAWIRQNNGPLKALFGGQGVQNLEAVAADLRRQAYKATATVGSDTAANLAAAKKFGLKELTTHPTAFMIAGDMIGDALGGHGLLGAGFGFASAGIGHLIHAMHQAGIETTNDLVREAMLHPSVARELLQKVPNGKIGPIFSARIARALQGIVVGSGAVAGNQGQRQ
jgi:hypothetical protein